MLVFDSWFNFLKSENYKMRNDFWQKNPLEIKKTLLRNNSVVNKRIY